VAAFGAAFSIPMLAGAPIAIFTATGGREWECLPGCSFSQCSRASSWSSTARSRARATRPPMAISTTVSLLRFPLAWALRSRSVGLDGLRS
jgi:hypothetical protein